MREVREISNLLRAIPILKLESLWWLRFGSSSRGILHARSIVLAKTLSYPFLSFLFFFIFLPSTVLQITHLENSLYVTYLQGTRSDTEYNLKSSGMLFDQNFVWKGLWTRFIKDHVSITFSISILCIFKRKDIYAVSTFERYLYLRYLDPMGILFIAADKKDCTFVKIKNKLISWLFIFLEIVVWIRENNEIIALIREI